MNHQIRNILLCSVVGMAIIERLWVDLGWNVELVTTVTVLAAIYGGKRWSVFVPLFVMAFSDVFIGNTSIALFTWSAYALAGLAVGSPGMKVKHYLSRLGVSIAAGIGISVWFFLWTNFGVWLLDSWGMYPRTWQGLLLSYVNGLPFFRNQLLGNLVLVPVFITGAEMIKICAQYIISLRLIKSEHIRLKSYAGY